ncbi:hypothetical protein Purlil1_12771 [Purpureocillium lilacinum]|uniref:Uncharacterized protein n=1 Tax=Purpureocillium lilacinum TaxID=33203 RepID=A0ABR0BGK4_PURLI|nr:hypothetical protein Purlil1_12771 [Purpureocillium lilacinum]
MNSHLLVAFAADSQRDSSAASGCQEEFNDAISPLTTTRRRADIEAPNLHQNYYDPGTVEGVAAPLMYAPRWGTELDNAFLVPDNDLWRRSSKRTQWRAD